MKISTKEINFFKENGYLQLDNLLNSYEIEKLLLELPNTIEKNSPRVIYESDGTIRSVFAPHFINEAYDQLSRVTRILSPAEQLIGTKVYLHQYKINSKKALKGEWWEWHQDFAYWHIDDGILKPNMVSAMIYLQNTDSTNGALMLIPKSHKDGVVKFFEKDPDSSSGKVKYNDHNKKSQYLSSLNSDLKFTIDHEIIKKLALLNGIVTASGSRGTVLFFDANLFHASNINMSPFDRDAILITYNSIDNLPTNVSNPRPDFLVGRNYTPLAYLDTLFV